ncbi:MAG: type I-C CRISPR-associated protein Cas7/Csd2 [Rhodocyclaceae bacterium]|nr:type I-C CRISPR-associated protein Cas7/Csd2 [Rhodocyclaceae bacterium]
MNNPLKHRYDFVLLFDVRDGNPNGDPDAGNLPRLDPETGKGLVTDVCLKRKVRNYVQLSKRDGDKAISGFDIYIKERAVLGRSHVDAFNDLKIELGQDLKVPVPEDLTESIREISLPEGMEIVEDDDKLFLVVSGTTDKKEAAKQIKEADDLAKPLAAFLNKALKDAKTRKPTRDETEKGRDWMCEHFYDIRTFGAVMSLKSAPNCGQVRGPVQMTFGRSIDPVAPMEHSITRMAVATEAEAEKQSGDNRTMGRKFTVPYGLYRSHGFISAHLAGQTKFDEDDLELFFQSLCQMFEHDRSAARGEMATRGLYVFKHESELGNAPAHALFNRLTVKRNGEDVARDFGAYSVLFDGQPVAVGEHDISDQPNVTLIRRC